jgi:GrpB-like predicted nucleotidyltransferase (UPF0157 family)
MPSVITIVPYRREWSEQFGSLGRELRYALQDLALGIDHIGSTAVPGLAAKDVLDIQVTARGLTTEVDEAVNGAGYERLMHITRDHVPPGGAGNPEQWSKWFYNQRGDGRRVNLHVRVAGRANQRYAVLFRDYLRANPAMADAYGQVKLALAAHHADDVETYYAIKDPVCDVIMGGAEGWAAATGWVPGPSDQ